MNIQSTVSPDPIGTLIKGLITQKKDSSAPAATASAESKPAAEIKADNVQVQRFSNPEFEALRQGQISLSRGASGDMVKSIQDAFLGMGFWTGGSTAHQGNGVYGQADGGFGPKMQTAVRNFQNNRGLPETGVIDKQTFAEIERLAPKPGETIWSPGYGAKDATFVPSNLLPNGERARAVVDLSEKRLFLYDKNNEVKTVFSVAVGKINQATGQSITTTGYRKVDARLNNPAWLGQQLWQNPDIFGPKLVGLGKYNPDNGHVSNYPHEIHGTNNENSIGDAASSGCVRMLNEAVEAFYPELKQGDIVYIKE